MSDNKLHGIELDGFRGRRLATFRCCDDLEKIIMALDTGEVNTADPSPRISLGHQAELINQVRVLKRTILRWNDGHVGPFNMQAY